MSMIKKI